jgi:hypothetical protein
MSRSRPSLVTSCTFGLAIALILAPVVASYGQRGEDPQPGKGADPCDHDPRGNARGRDRLCPPQGSSNGIARGDFNGDGIGLWPLGFLSKTSPAFRTPAESM